MPKKCFIIGDPVSSSLSPLMHNHAYKVLGIEDKFIYGSKIVNAHNVKEFMSTFRTEKYHGASCTMPVKELLFELIDDVDPVAEKIGAVNTIINEDGKLKGYNTDWLGFINPLQERATLKNKIIGIIGSGGAAGAAAFGSKEAGAKIKIFSRNSAAAQKLAYKYSADAYEIDNVSMIKECDIIFNATPVGMFPDIKDIPVDKKIISSGQIIFDSIYRPLKTTLLQEAENIGAVTINGLEMLLHQGIAQFELFTGEKAPVSEMKNVLLTAFDS